MEHDVLIIGGGAAGLMAAAAASEYKIDAAIIEGSDRVGKKLLITGNGRCNISNSSIDLSIKTFHQTSKKYGDTTENKACYHSFQKGFFIPVLKNFTVQDTINFFTLLGLPIVELEEQKLYPMSLQASTVLDIFRMTAADRNIPIYTEHKVSSIISAKQGFKIICKTKEGDKLFGCKKIILCTGGKAAPSTGSDGSGYSLAKALGHSIIPPVPALVQLRLDYNHLKALSGVKFDGYAALLSGNKLLQKEFGEILFTDYGISGPPILQLSRQVSAVIENKIPVSIRIDMLPRFSDEDLKDLLETHWAMIGHRSILDSLNGIINKRLIPVILKEALIFDMHKPVYELNWEEKKSLYKLLKCWEFKISGTNPFSNAQVTAGGVNTEEVNPHTLESKIVKNLYFAGELLDVDGDCGGYNLQWAWSSGYVAAKSAAEDLIKHRVQP